MPRLRFLTTFSIVVLVIVGFFTLSGRGQTTASPRRLLSGFAPPAIQGGISPDLSHAPGTPETLRRQSVRRASGVVDRVGASGARYRPGTRDRQVQGRRLGGHARIGALGGLRAGHDVATCREPGFRCHQHRSSRRCRGCGTRVQGPAGRRVCAGGVPRARRVRSQRRVLFDAVEPAVHQHGGRLGHSAGGRLRDHGRGARYRYRVHGRRTLQFHADAFNDRLRGERRPSRQRRDGLSGAWGYGAADSSRRPSFSR